MRRASLVPYRRFHRETWETRVHFGASQEAQYASGNDVGAFSQTGRRIFVLSAVLSAQGRISCVLSRRCPFYAVPQLLESVTEREKNLKMGLDTRGFVISRSPVRSRRVAPFIQRLTTRFFSIISLVSDFCQQTEGFCDICRISSSETHSQNQ